MNEIWMPVALPPGWLNVYVDLEARELFATPCPAVLLEELRESDGRTCEPPYETRVSWATPDECGLVAASDAHNHAGVAAPGEAWHEKPEVIAATLERFEKRQAVLDEQRRRTRADVESSL